jgi:transcriptional regulator with XRE-family HTH domain
MSCGSVPNPGDLGRRIGARRQQLGWSRAELAAKAHLSVPYLSYLETRPAVVTMTCLIELAEALETTAEALLGAGPAAQAAARARPALDGLWAADVRTGRRSERPGPFLG